MTAEYATAPQGKPDTLRTVHIMSDHFAPRTLCGKRVHDEWALGDETMSGIAATCRRCRSIFGVKG